MPRPAPKRSAETVPPPGEQIRRLIERLAFQTNQAARSAGPDAIHDLRVAIRRLEQALVSFKADLPRKPVKKIRKQLKPVLSCAGTLRDYDVAAKILAKTKGPGAVAVLRHVRAHRKTTEQSLRARLKRSSFRVRVAKWCDDLKLAALAGETDAAQLERIGRDTLPPLARRFFEAGEAAAAQGSGETLHAFRIRTKKFRYALELFVPVYGSQGEEWIREIKSVQSALGAMNDYRTVLSLAADFGGGRELRAALKRSERRAVRRFRQIWSEQFSGAAAAQWMRALAARSAVVRIRRKPVVTGTAGTQAVMAAGA